MGALQRRLGTTRPHGSLAGVERTCAEDDEDAEAMIAILLPMRRLTRRLTVRLRFLNLDAVAAVSLKGGVSNATFWRVRRSTPASLRRLTEARSLTAA